MAKTLKQLDKEILERIKKIQLLVARWSMMTKQENERSRMDDYYYEKTGMIRNEIECEIICIYRDVMEQDEIESHTRQYLERIKSEFGGF